MKYLALLSYLFFIPTVSADEPQPVKVYCFSADLEAGFKDSGAAFFCKELAKRGTKKKSIEVTQEKTLADVTVEYLGKEAISAKGETTYLLGGYAWTPDQFKNGVRAVISVGTFSKGFYGEGANDSAAYSVWTQVESWIRENRDVIQQKAKQK